MDERRMRFRVGVVALATIIVAATLVFLIGGAPSLLHATYPLHIKFEQAPGVAVETPVRKFGIRIGKVSNVTFAPDDTGAVVTVEIDQNVKLKIDKTFRINTGVLGDAVLEVIKSDDELPPDVKVSSEAELPEHQPNDVLRGQVRSDPLQMVANLEGKLAEALGSIGSTSDEIGELAKHVNDLLGNNEEQVVRIVAKVEKTVDRLASAVASTDDLLSDPVLRENLKRSISDFPEVLTDAREAIGGLKTALAGVDRNLANLEGFTRPLGERGDVLVGNIESSVGKLDKILSDLSTFSSGLNNSTGSLGQLMNSPDVYQQLNEAATNINQLTKELRPIVADARIFSDKLARHGLNGALKRDTGIKRSPTDLGLERIPSGQRHFPLGLRHE
ncbi:MAG TPA: MlaD family protein [Pirellulales bacterium]|nr:MlaD family protein [Pirellulales bacterium]